jgi:FAD/FMN-containing dehydrogenase
MDEKLLHKKLQESLQIKGDLELGDLYRAMYATDASIYRQLPLGVVFPKDEEDIQTIIKIAGHLNIALIPRTAGTSLAGQCVGDGLVVDVSRYMISIQEFNAEEGWVKVQPGVIRDELNHFLKNKGFFFSPITSTANRAMIGGMVGNNSSGTTSIKYGVTRDKVISIDAILSDGSKVCFEPT